MFVIDIIEHTKEAEGGRDELIHRSIPDPARESGSDEETLERTATELCGRIGFLIEAIEQTTTSQEVTERCLTSS